MKETRSGKSNPCASELQLRFARGGSASLIGAPVDRSGLTVLNLFVQKLVSIRVVYPSALHPPEPRINQNLRTDRPEVLTKYGLWGSSIKYGYEAF